MVPLSSPSSIRVYFSFMPSTCFKDWKLSVSLLYVACDVSFQQKEIFVENKDIFDVSALPAFENILAKHKFMSSQKRTFLFVATQTNLFTNFTLFTKWMQNSLLLKLTYRKSNFLLRSKACCKTYISKGKNSICKGKICHGNLKRVTKYYTLLHWIVQLKQAQILPRDQLSCYN